MRAVAIVAQQSALAALRMVVFGAGIAVVDNQHQRACQARGQHLHPRRQGRIQLPAIIVIDWFW